ncbi:MAG: hypothetical protein GY913_27525 [Proteobacteria bacterium]|nr:hypothetical protein [Pseudomonadota bacterium]MCP4920667.1 hypothetical protein [Pseudomonadota bacterium]
MLFLLFGCGGGNFLASNDLSCQYNAYTWWDDMAMYVDRGETTSELPNTFTWDFEYEPSYVKNITGKYSTRSGNFEYTVEYTGDSWLKSKRTVADFANYGTVYTNGNLDLRSMVTVEDTLGNTSTYVRRDERKGCKGTVKYRYVEDDGSIPKYPEQTVSYEIINDTKVDWESYEESGSTTNERWGFWTSEFNYVENVSYDSSTLAMDSWEKTTSDGRAESEWSQLSKSNNFLYVGNTQSEKNGSWVDEYTVAEGDDEPFVTVHVEREYSGDGWATWTYDDGSVCDVTYTGYDTCKYDCGGGDSGNC